MCDLNYTHLLLHYHLLKCSTMILLVLTSNYNVIIYWKKLYAFYMFLFKNLLIFFYRITKLSNDTSIIFLRDFNLVVI